MNNQYKHLQTTYDSNVLATFVHETDRMTSLEIAEVTGRQHYNVMRDIRNILDQGVAELNFELGSYKDKNNQQRPMYTLTKKGCLILASGYDAVLREKIINRWEELERKERQQQEPLDEDKAILFALTTLQKRVEIKEKEIKQLQQQTQVLTAQNQLQEHALKIQAPKVEYHDKVLSSTSTYDTTQIAKELGMSAITLNKKLQDLKVQYKLSGQWILYAKYQNKGYTDTRTHQYTDSQGASKTSMLTVWTEQGRKFIHSLINK